MHCRGLTCPGSRVCLGVSETAYAKDCYVFTRKWCKKTARWPGFKVKVCELELNQSNPLDLFLGHLRQITESVGPAAPASASLCALCSSGTHHSALWSLLTCSLIISHPVMMHSLRAETVSPSFFSSAEHLAGSKCSFKTCWVFLYTFKHSSWGHSTLILNCNLPCSIFIALSII